MEVRTLPVAVTRADAGRSRRGTRAGTVGIAAGSIALLAITALPVAGQGTYEGPGRTVEVPGTPRLLTPDVQPLFTVGRLEGPDGQVFGDVEEVAFGPDGRLYVLDRTNARVSAFSPDGQLLHAFGGEGDGPAEFRFPRGLAVDGSGHVWVGDGLGRSLKVFDPEGGLVATLTLGVDGRPDFAGLTASSSDGVVVLERQRHAVDGEVPIYRVVPTEGGDPDVVELARVGVPFVPRVEQSGSTFRMISAPTFTAPVRVTALPGGRAARLTGPRYEIDVVTSDGVETRILAPALEPAPVTEAHQEQEKERRRELNREAREASPVSVGGFTVGAPSAEALEASLAEMRFADVHGVVRGMDASPEGVLWIQRWAGSPWGPAPIDLVSVADGYLGTLPELDMPDAVGPEGRVAYVRTDDLGVERVEVMRIDGVSPSGAPRGPDASSGGVATGRSSG